MGSVQQRIKEFERWPKYYHLYMVAFEKMIENRGGRQELSDSRGCDEGCNQRQVASDREVRPDFTDARAIMEWWIF